jgi:SPP1 gp7 family putative phage head morphogenesis protein
VASKTIKGKFRPSPTAERDFMRSLKKVARVSGHIIENHVDGVKINDDAQLQRLLREYSKLIGPWANRQSQKLLQQVQRSNKRAYANKSKALGKAFKAGMGDTQVGEVAMLLQIEQVGLIQSIPIEAGVRAQKIAYEAALHGTRAQPDLDTIAELQKQLGLSTEVAISRAQLIAVTETARANASINQARAMAVGSPAYRWHNSGDAAVRKSHKTYKGQRLQGKIFHWDKPPTLDDGMQGHPGTFPRCRCFAEPIFDDE